MRCFLPSLRRFRGVPGGRAAGGYEREDRAGMVHVDSHKNEDSFGVIYHCIFAPVVITPYVCTSRKSVYTNYQLVQWHGTTHKDFQKESKVGSRNLSHHNEMAATDAKFYGQVIL